MRPIDEQCTREILELLRSIKTNLKSITQELNLKNQNDARRNQEEAERRDRAANVAISHVPVEIHSFPAPSDEDVAYEGEKHTRERRRFTIEKWTLAVLAVYTAITGGVLLLTKRAVGNSEESFKQTLCQMKAQTAAQGQAAGAAEKAATIAEESLVKVQSALLVFDKIQQTPLSEMTHAQANQPSAKAPYEWMALWENAGSTPAKKVRSNFSIEEASNKDIQDGKLRFRIPVIFNPQPAAGPRTQHFTTVASYYGDLATLNDRKKTLIFWGVLVYRDIFEKTERTPAHVTEYCFWLRQSFMLSTGELEGAAFNSCIQHNCTDEDCEDYEQIVKQAGI